MNEKSLVKILGNCTETLVNANGLLRPIVMIYHLAHHQSNRNFLIKCHTIECSTCFDHTCFGHTSQVWNSWFILGQIGTSWSNAILLLNVPPAWNSKESEQSICVLFSFLYVSDVAFLYGTALNDSFTVLLRITSDCLHQMTCAAMSSRSQSQIQVYFRGNHSYCQRLWRRSAHMFYMKLRT